MLLPDTSVTKVMVLAVRISGLDSQQEYISSTPLCPDWLWIGSCSYSVTT